VAALSPGAIPEWVQEKTAAMADPEFRRLYLVCDEAFDWDPADPRLAELADAMVAWKDRHPHPESSPPELSADSMVAVTLMTSYVASSSPSWHRLGQFSLDQQRARRR
jgi:hypothetical protein